MAFTPLSVWPESSQNSIYTSFDGWALHINWSAMSSRIICIAKMSTRTRDAINFRFAKPSKPFVVSAFNDRSAAFNTAAYGTPFDWPHYLVANIWKSDEAPGALIIDASYRGRTENYGVKIDMPAMVTIVIFPGADVHTEMANVERAYSTRVLAEVQKISLPLVLSAIIAEYAADFEGWAIGGDIPSRPCKSGPVTASGRASFSKLSSRHQ